MNCSLLLRAAANAASACFKASLTAVLCGIGGATRGVGAVRGGGEIGFYELPRRDFDYGDGIDNEDI
jgi:hypothetical protein